MIGSKMGLGIIAIIGLLFVSNTFGSGCYETRDGKYICEEYLSFKDCEDTINTIILSKMQNIPQLIQELKQFNEICYIYTLVIFESNITELPGELLTLDGLESLEVSRNNISSINLNILPYAKNLNKLNVSHNGIKEFEIDSSIYTSTKRLQYIDLSYNLIDHIPVNCFYSTRDSLLHLDLSHNRISSFDFYAFSSLALLKTLRLSHNNLVQLNFFLYPLRNLNALYLDNNQLKEINSEVFDKSSRLTNLDLSYNNIENIEDRTFGALENLINLNVSNNGIKSIKEILLRNSTRLETVNFSFNNISYMEPGVFSSTENLIYVGLEGALAMPIQENMFTGVKVNKLNFANSTITKIEARPFISMSNNLVSLNLSSSTLQEISETAFDTLTNLNELDLSNNKLSEIAFQTVDLENLSKLYLQNNSIRELKPETFQHLLSLIELDLSDNNIQTISPMTFKNLKKLKLFNIHNNSLGSIVLSNAFFGLEHVEQLELINTNVMRWESYALSGLKNLKVLNASHGQLSYIDYYAFTETGNIEILDLSYNQIQHFNVKLLPNKNMKELYLNNNQFGNILKNAFEGLGALSILNLSDNNLVTVDSSAFSSLNSLKRLDLSHNPDLKLGDNVFHNLLLETVLMRGVSNQISFKSGTVSITNLDLSSSHISNVSLLHLHNIQGLTELNLSENNITTLDQFSFADFMYSLTSLNLNHNNLVDILPGTFLKTRALNYLDISHNKLKRIKFGALGGLENLYTLDLSNNILTSFKLSLLYNIKSVSTILLDDNRIYSISTTDKLYDLNKLSIGGNCLSCDDLMDLIMLSNVDIFARTLDYFTENVDGIPCTLFPIVKVDEDPNIDIATK